MRVTRTYQNGFVRIFTVKSVRWANAEKTAAVMTTEESGDVLTGIDQPEVWAQLVQSSLHFKDAPEPPKASDEELAGILLKLEALDRVKKMTPEEKARLEAQA